MLQREPFDRRSPRSARAKRANAAGATEERVRRRRRERSTTRKAPKPPTYDAMSAYLHPLEACREAAHPSAAHPSMSAVKKAPSTQRSAVRMSVIP